MSKTAGESVFIVFRAGGFFLFFGGLFLGEKHV